MADTAASSATASRPTLLRVQGVRVVEGIRRRLRQGRARSTHQAILPIPAESSIGEKARIDKVLANTEVQAIISALGTGIHEEFNDERLRYHKIVLMADADVDGHHIRTLLLTLLFRFMKPLIEGIMSILLSHAIVCAETSPMSMSSCTPMPSATTR
ncbi:MAG: toprim domain-containing protein [Marmoricola sp.]